MIVSKVLTRSSADVKLMDAVKFNAEARPGYNSAINSVSKLSTIVAPHPSLLD